MRIYERSEWGAQYRDGVGNRKVGRLDKIAHHTVTTHLTASASIAQECAEMRKIERIGQQRFGAGMSYSFIVFPSGRVYRGVSTHRISYHTGSGRNTTGVAVCYPGNYETRKPTTAQLAATADLLRHGVKQGWWTVPKIELAHRQVKSTACPGRYYFAAIPEINRLAGAPSGSTVASPRPVTPAKQTTAGTPPKGAGVAKGISVKQVQEQLRDAGFYNGKIDNIDGPLTKTAIYGYQKNQRYFPGLKVDGVWGTLTQKHYEWVKSLQVALNKWRAVIRLGKTRVDGDYGAFAARCVDAVIAANFNGAYKTAVRSMYGTKAVPVNDKTPGKAFCKMVGIKTHPMVK